MSSKLVLVLTIVSLTQASVPSATNLIQDIYTTCLNQFSFSCIKPKALAWMSYVADKPEIQITEDLTIIKKSTNEERTNSDDILEKFEDFIQNHELVAKVPKVLQPGGFLGGLVPRNMKPEDLRVPLAATGRSKIVKKVIVPFLLGLKFKTAVLVPLALALIAMKTWKALTLGLLSLVLTGALLIFKLSKPQVNYEVVHFPQHHVEHHVDHPPTTGWEHPGYGRELSAQEMAYNAYL